MNKPLKFKCVACGKQITTVISILNGGGERRQFDLLQAKANLKSLQKTIPYLSTEFNSEAKTLCQKLEQLDKEAEPLWRKCLNLLKQLLKEKGVKLSKENHSILLCKSCLEAITPQAKSAFDELMANEKFMNIFNEVYGDNIDSPNSQLNKFFERLYSKKLISNEQGRKVEEAVGKEIEEEIFQELNVQSIPEKNQIDQTKPSQQPPKTNPTPWIIGGILGGGAIIGLIIWLVRQNKKPQAKKT